MHHLFIYLKLMILLICKGVFFIVFFLLNEKSYLHLKTYKLTENATATKANSFSRSQETSWEASCEPWRPMASRLVFAEAKRRNKKRKEKRKGRFFFFGTLFLLSECFFL